MDIKKEGLNWYGWMSPSSGYGVVNLEYACALERASGNVDIGWERWQWGDPEWNGLTQEQKNLMNKPFKQHRVGVIKTTPQKFSENKSEFRIGYTMVENTKMCKEWADVCNSMDAIFVPSAFLVDVFKESGVKKPIYVVKQGVDPIKFPYMTRKPKDKFIFGTLGYIDERKNWKDLVQAFCSEFNKNEPVELWIKNNSPYFNQSFTDSRVKNINKTYSLTDMKRLYELMDCFVFPSHSEGSGLPPREAMSTGLPVILTNWSGLSEVCDERFNYPLTPVAIDYPEAAHRVETQPGVQARIDVAELMYLMRYVYEHPQESRTKGIAASEYIQKEWSWDKCAENLISTLESIC